jgi:hypothetical protein
MWWLINEWRLVPSGFSTSSHNILSFCFWEFRVLDWKCMPNNWEEFTLKKTILLNIIHFIKVSSYAHMSSRTNGKTYRPTFCKHLEPSTHLCHSNVQTVFVIISVWNCIISLISTRPHLGQNFLSSAGTARDPSWSVGLVSRIISQDQRFPRTERLESYSSIFCNISHLVKANCNT